MDPVIKKSNILILKGVFPEDFSSIDNVFTKKDEATKPDSISVYTKLPKRFTGTENWPKVCNLRCRYCDLLINDYPRFIPRNPELGKDGIIESDVDGPFNTWNCCIKHIELAYPRDQRWDASRLTCMVASQFEGKRIIKILPSPDKYIMKQYCGEDGCTPKEYMDKIHTMNNNYDISKHRLEDFRGSD